MGTAIIMTQLNFSFEAPLTLLSADEIFQGADHALLTMLREDRRIERKPANTHGRVLGEYFSMWANTSPEGGLNHLGNGKRRDIFWMHGS